MEVGLDVTEILMKHWGMVRLLTGTDFFHYDDGLEDLDSIDEVRKEVLGNRDQYELYDVTFFNPVVDRKSTRLNSSHVKISYAVFCLKKKTQSIQPMHRPWSTSPVLLF